MTQLSLYPPKPSKPGYLLDNMVLIGLARRYNPPEIRKSANTIVDSLIAEGRIKSSYEVYHEINYGVENKKADEVCRLAETYKAGGVFEVITFEDQENIAKVLEEFPNFLKQDSERPDADPWLVALAMRYPGWTVVSRDGDKDTPGLKKLKQVCKHFKIDCLNDYEFLKQHGWSI